MTTSNITQTHDHNTNTWYLSMPYTTESLKELKILIKEASAILDKSRRNVRDIDIMDSIDEFIRSKYITSISNNVPVDALRKDFIKFMGDYDITPHKFGRLMTSYISSDKNALGVRRIAIRSGAAYSGIRRKENKISSTNTETIRPVSLLINQ